MEYKKRVRFTDEYPTEIKVIRDQQFMRDLQEIKYELAKLKQDTSIIKMNLKIIMTKLIDQEQAPKKSKEQTGGFFG